MRNRSLTFKVQVNPKLFCVMIVATMSTEEDEAKATSEPAGVLYWCISYVYGRIGGREGGGWEDSEYI